LGVVWLLAARRGILRCGSLNPATRALVDAPAEYDAPAPRAPGRAGDPEFAAVYRGHRPDGRALDRVQRDAIRHLDASFGGTAVNTSRQNPDPGDG
jgi:hypothetical protein